MPNIRVLPPPNGPFSITLTGNRTLSTTAGQYIDVDAADAWAMAANGWVMLSRGGIGPTSSRLSSPYLGTQFTDTTVAAVIVWDGATWRNAVTGAAA
jgi:hypothetical protein